MRRIVALSVLLAAGASGQVQTLSQSTNPNVITPANSIACTVGSIPAGNWTTQANGWLRAYSLAGLAPTIGIASIRFGVETVITPAPGGFPLEIRLYADPNGGVPSPLSSLVPRHLQSFSVPVSAAGTIVTQPLTGAVPIFSATETLVVELTAPLGPIQTVFFVGSNALGQTGPTYIRAPACGFSDPTNVASIGSPNMHVILDVNYFDIGASGVPYPGTNDDLTLWTATNTNPLTTGPAYTVKGVNEGAFMSLKVGSNAAFNLRPVFVIAQSFTTGGAPPVPTAPHIFMSYPELTFLVGELGNPFVALLPPGGITLSYSIPYGYAGSSVLIQGVVVTSFPPFPANGVYAATDAHEIKIL